MSGTPTTGMAQEMEARLREAFDPTRLEVINDSAQHSGHSGDDGSGESHFTIVIEAPQFGEMNRLARQRAVIDALGDIVGERVHAVAIKASAPTV
ncbi:MAG: BolA family protein [Erythrobacter sp.]|uniref:BolA family protein n=1 Tax=Erythrobacter sp. TaxID=1042 RepID=UPI003C70858E